MYVKKIYKEGKTFHIWQCNYCLMVGTYEQLEKNPCDYYYEPCEYCGMPVECQPDCSGVSNAVALASIDVNN